MNKAQRQKNVGSRVRLRPQATAALGAHDDDWTVRKVTDETLELVNERTHHVATLGLDAVKTYASDPAIRRVETKAPKRYVRLSGN